MTGCGSGLPRVYPVKGTVAIKGKGSVKDLAGYNVEFESVKEPKEIAGGRVEEDGTFTMYTRVGTKAIAGVKEGSYRARLFPHILEGGGSAPLVIPGRYTAFGTSKLQFEVKPGDNNLTIDIDRTR